MHKPDGALRYRLSRRVAKSSPGLVRAAARFSDLVVRSVLSPQVPVPPPARRYASDELEQLTDTLNEAAEGYFSRHRSPEFERFLLDKPYSSIEDFPTYLFNVATMAHWLRLRPDDIVLELGAGSAWVSHFFNQFGCRTISVDVSPSAIALGRRLFEQSNRTQWHRAPTFLSYDGRRLPLDDAGCDRIVIHDAFHHVPNQREMLGEMHRVLRDGGIVAMSEPGRRHSLSEESCREVTETGVLENDIVVEELAELAAACGFRRTTVVPLSLKGSTEVDAADLVPFLRGAGFTEHWISQTNWLLAGHFILLYKGEPTPDTRRPGRLRARIDPDLEGALVVSADGPTPFECRIVNEGDTVWLTDPTAEYGTTRLGVQLVHSDGTVLDRDWLRVLIGPDVAPGETRVVTVELPALTRDGPHRIVLDMVAEQVGWFADSGSCPASVDLEVTAST